MMLREVRSPEDIMAITEETGFLPFFRNHIPGFSVEELCPGELWFSDTQDGPWEWKGPVARSGRCVYGKFFRGKAGFVSREWFADFANFRRDGYDFDARFDDGLASLRDKGVFDTLMENGATLSKELREKCGAKGFDTVITRLQMQTYVVIGDFVYMRDRRGKVYGWGVAKYAVPEALLGAGRVTAAYSREPSESKGRIVEHLKSVLPDVDEAEILKLVN